MAATAADVLIETLLIGVSRSSSGFPATASTASWRRCARAQDKIRFIQVRHEEAAAFMACAYAKCTGKLGVCLATSGPGGIHLLNGLYDAKLDGQPVLAITGMHLSRPDRHAYPAGRRARQAVHGRGRLQRARHGARRTSRTSSTWPAARRSAYRGVAHVTFPVDMQEMEARARSGSQAQHAAPHLGRVRAGARGCRPRTTRARGRHAERRQEGCHPGRPRRARRRRRAGAVAERLGAPIVKALLGKAAVPDDSPYTTGGIGLLGTRPSQEAMEECDTLLIVGSSFPYIEFCPKPGQARGVQIELDPMRIGLRYPVEVGLVGDSRARSGAPAAAASRRTTAAFSRRPRSGMEEWRQLMEERGDADRHADEAAGRGLGAGQAAAATTRSSAATAAPSPPGGRGRSRPGAGRCTRVRQPGQRWPTGCPTRSRRRSPTRSGSASPSWATAASRC